MQHNEWDNLDVVPSEMLGPFSPDDFTDTSPADAAEMLDHYLRRLARQEALGRLVLGKLARRMIAMRGYNALGFVRLADYSRERLGLSGSEVDTLARVAKRLEDLPEIASAFERGRLGWTKLRLISSIATPQSQSHWLTLAMETTAMELATLVRNERRSGSASTAQDPAPTGDLLIDASGDDDASIDGEPRASFKLTCPRPIRSLWRRANELAQRMAGTPLSQWQAAEAIAAEAASMADPRRIGPSGAAAAGLAISTAPTESDEQRPGCGNGDGSEQPIWQSLERLMQSGLAPETIPDDLERLGDYLDGVSVPELDQRMRTVLTSMQRVDWQVGRLLRAMVEMKLYRRLRFPSSAAYISDRLGMSVRKARALLRVDRKSAACHLELTRAYRDGEISWLRALALLPVIGRANARAWLDRARSVTLRRLIDEVEWALDRCDRASVGQPVMPPPMGARLEEVGTTPEVQIGVNGSSTTTPAMRHGINGPAARIAFSGPASVVLLLRDVLNAFAEPAEPPWRGFARMLSHVIEHWEAQEPRPHPVLLRDRWRCRVPACNSRRHLEKHHVLYRSRGGHDGAENLVTLCAWHHRRGIHGGRIRVRGNADGDLEWELGLRRDKPSLLRLVEDTYVMGRAADQPQSGSSSLATTSPPSMCVSMMSGTSATVTPVYQTPSG